jgi:hypothetical protein
MKCTSKWNNWFDSLLDENIETTTFTIGQNKRKLCHAMVVLSLSYFHLITK